MGLTGQVPLGLCVLCYHSVFECFKIRDILVGFPPRQTLKPGFENKLFVRCSNKQDQCKDPKMPSIREIEGLEGGSLLCITELSTAVIQTGMGQDKASF